MEFLFLFVLVLMVKEGKFSIDNNNTDHHSYRHRKKKKRPFFCHPPSYDHKPKNKPMVMIQRHFSLVSLGHGVVNSFMAT
ncbi:hypothetical protein BDF14DRAFT_1030013 [Spinellus fusiger]|nr:hypothetical protein BDF14DRAFT_1030013 [Spinellus fusiger]